MRRLLGVLLVVFIFSMGIQLVNVEGEGMVIEKGRQVSFEYTLTVDGEVVDSSEGRSPFQYTHGERQIVPGLEKNLEGLHVGDEKNIIVSPEEGYGILDPKAFNEVPRSSLPADIDLRPGLALQATNPNGEAVTVKIAEVRDDAVLIDHNHPLAGKTLNFQVKIISIE